MKLYVSSLLALSLLTANAAEETKSPAVPKTPDKHKVSYALGMNLALQRQHTEGNVTVDGFVDGLRDTLDGRPTRLKEAEAVNILNQARADRLNDQDEAAQKDKISYALGMRTGGQLKRVGAEIDTEVLIEGFRDLLAGKPTQLKESEIEPLMQQAQAYGVARQSEKNKMDAKAFFAKNAKAPGVITLPDGLQYRVIKEGKGPLPATNELMIVKYVGKFLDGSEFDEDEHFLTISSGGPKGWQEALQRMRVGSKWQVFMPSELAFGQEGEPGKQIGPDASLIYDFEIVYLPQPGDPLIGTGAVGHGLNGILKTLSAPPPDGAPESEHPKETQ